MNLPKTSLSECQTFTTSVALDAMIRLLPLWISNSVSDVSRNRPNEHCLVRRVHTNGMSFLDGEHRREARLWVQKTHFANERNRTISTRNRFDRLASLRCFGGQARAHRAQTRCRGKRSKCEPGWVKLGNNKRLARAVSVRADWHINCFPIRLRRRTLESGVILLHGGTKEINDINLFR